MTDLNSRHWALLAALSDGLPQHVSQLARVVGMFLSWREWSG